MVQMESVRSGVRTDGLAVAALIAGALSIPSSFVVAGLLFGGAAFMMGLVSFSRIKSDSGLKGEHMALLGLSLGLTGFVLSVTVPTLLLIVMSMSHAR